LHPPGSFGRTDWGGGIEMSPDWIHFLKPRVGDLRQLANVRRIVLDDGTERGVRALSFSTGGGLDFWVLTDRSMDIGTLSWQGVQIAWQAASGF
ncbi:MAG: aldose 1-epimerase family protein, partial [Planifilum fulgidum]